MSSHLRIFCLGGQFANFLFGWDSNSYFTHTRARDPRPPTHAHTRAHTREHAASLSLPLRLAGACLPSPCLPIIALPWSSHVNERLIASLLPELCCHVIAGACHRIASPCLSSHAKRSFDFARMVPAWHGKRSFELLARLLCHV